MQIKQKKIMLVTGYNSMTEVFNRNLVRILQAENRVVFVAHVEDISKYGPLSGYYDLPHVKRNNGTIAKISRYLSIQLRIAYYAFKEKDCDIYMFFPTNNYCISIALTRILCKGKIVSFIGGVMSEMYKAKKSLFYYPLRISENISYSLSHSIIVYSENIITAWGLKKYAGKVSFAHEHIIDVEAFKVSDPYGDRKNIVGFIGRLSEEKGILEFVQAIPEIAGKKKDMKFLIIGDGPLAPRVREYLEKNGLKGIVEMKGWVPHEQLPGYLNKLKLIVIPSYTEGLPNAMLEAMACGAPALAAPVGAIPDIIRDGDNGFLMENNSVDAIAANVVRVFDGPDLATISENARGFVEKNFSFEATVKNFSGLRLAD
jgi:glycosyltransferase involved in cell wall biosynthesis